MPDRALGRAVGSTAHRVLRLRRRIVEQQLSASFPSAEREWLERTAARCYRHFGEEFALLARGRRRIDRALDTVKDVDDARNVVEGCGALDGAVVVLGHLGNWELAGGFCQRLGYPLAAVARRQGIIDRRLNAVRAGMGIEVIDRNASARTLVRRLRSGVLLALVADQHVWRGGVELEFLGRPAWTTLGPARLALAAEVPLIFTALLRDGSGYRIHVRALDRPQPRRGETEAVAWTRVWVQALETEIRERPEQYFWFHRRWKTRGSGEAEPGNDDPGLDVQASENG